MRVKRKSKLFNPFSHTVGALQQNTIIVFQRLTNPKVDLLRVKKQIYELTVNLSPDILSTYIRTLDNILRRK